MMGDWAQTSIFQLQTIPRTLGGYQCFVLFPKNATNCGT